MTPLKCKKHELRPGEFGDSPRYLKAISESMTCWRCRILAIGARIQYWWDTL